MFQLSSVVFIRPVWRVWRLACLAHWIWQVHQMVTSCAVMVFRGACTIFPAHGPSSMFWTLHSVFNPAFVNVPYQFLCNDLVLTSRQGVSFLQLHDRHSGADRSDRFTCKQLIKHVTTFRWQLWWRLQTIDNKKNKKGKQSYFQCENETGSQGPVKTECSKSVSVSNRWKRNKPLSGATALSSHQRWTDTNTG